MSGIVQIGGVALASHDEGTDKVSLNSGTVFPAGHVLNVVNEEFAIAVDISSEEEKICDKAITLVGANSNLMIFFKSGYRPAATTTYSDVDHAWALGWKTGAVSATQSDYTAIHTWSPAKEKLTTLNAFRSHDALAGTTIYTTYEVSHFCEADLGTVSAGTVVNVSAWGSAENGHLYVGGPDNVPTGGSGGCLTAFTIFEIAG